MELTSNDSSLSGLPKRKNTKIYVLILCVVFVLAIIFAVFHKQGIWFGKKSINLPLVPQYTKTDLPANKLPEVFPKDLIQEKGPMILESYQAEIKDRFQTQYTLKYITKKSVDENFKLYQKYFNDNQWYILNKDQKENFAIIRATKDLDSITVMHTINQTNGVQIIDLTLTHFIFEESTSTTNQNIN